MREDVERGAKGVKGLLIGYKDDADVCRRGFDVVHSLDETAVRVRVFVCARARALLQCVAVCCSVWQSVTRIVLVLRLLSGCGCLCVRALR